MRRDKRLREVRVESREGWDSPAAFLHPTPAQILGPLCDTLLLLPQKARAGCVETHRAGKGRTGKHAVRRQRGRAGAFAVWAAESSLEKHLPQSPGKIHQFYLPLLVSVLPIPPSQPCCLLVLLQCILIHYSSPAGLSVLTNLSISFCESV